MNENAAHPMQPGIFDGLKLDTDTDKPFDADRWLERFTMKPETKRQGSFQDGVREEQLAPFSRAPTSEHLWDNVGERREWMLDAYSKKVLGLLYRDTVSCREIRALHDALNRLRATLSEGDASEADVREPRNGLRTASYLAIAALDGERIEGFRGHLHKYFPTAILETLGLDDRCGPVLLGRANWESVREAYRRFSIRLAPPAPIEQWQEPLKIGRRAHRWFYFKTAATVVVAFFIAYGALALCGYALRKNVESSVHRMYTPYSSAPPPMTPADEDIPKPGPVAESRYFEEPSERAAAYPPAPDAATQLEALRAEIADLRRDLGKRARRRGG